MRIWTIHPKYLDVKGLVAVWRETLLAKNVLLGNTKGYKNHPQLDRFKQTTSPVNYINQYLYHIYVEALNRNYKFDVKKIDNFSPVLLNGTDKQIEFEFKHLKNKLKFRDIKKYKELLNVNIIKSHPMFNIISGNVESWEKGI